jgi:hypothetical protein
MLIRANGHANLFLLIPVDMFVVLSAVPHIGAQFLGIVPPIASTLPIAPSLVLSSRNLTSTDGECSGWWICGSNPGSYSGAAR